jgi:hypothetical protein
LDFAPTLVDFAYFAAAKFCRTKAQRFGAAGIGFGPLEFATPENEKTHTKLVYPLKDNFPNFTLNWILRRHL